METPLSKTCREHYLSVAVARHVFTHPSRGVVFVRDAIRLADADRFDLTPLVIFAFSVPHTRLRWMTFALQNNTISLLRVILDAWSLGSEILRGYPDILKVSCHVADAAPGLRSSLAPLGVRLEVADGKDRVFSGALRSAQNDVLSVGWFTHDEPIKTVEDLRRSTHVFYTEGWNMVSYRDPKSEEDIRAFLSLPVRTIHSKPSCEQDWTPGRWMSAWDAQVPPTGPRYFYIDDDGTNWLVEGLDDVDELEDSYIDHFGSTDMDGCDIVRTLLRCWPNKLLDVARTIGITAKELRWCLADRIKIQGVFPHLYSMIGVEYKFGFWQACGGCILVGMSGRATVAAYEELSHGGDLEFSFEAVPETSEPDPKWHYIVLRACGSLVNLIVIPRGSGAANILDADHLINFEGVSQVPNDVYFTIVTTCARGRVNPYVNREECASFERKCFEYLQSCVRW